MGCPCKDRGTFNLTVPAEAYDYYERNIIPEIVNHGEIDVSFAAWLTRDPKMLLIDKCEEQFHIDFWWHRNFYSDVQIVANDLHARELLEARDYVINIDW